MAFPVGSLVVEEFGEVRLVDGLLVAGLQLGCLGVALRDLPLHGQRVEELVQAVLDKIVLEMKRRRFIKNTQYFILIIV